jgi:glycosyltransferase involved in cell wall biosynthesis
MSRWTTVSRRPVSIHEAQSCGIPVLATAVGGVPELVGDHNGWLLPENPSPDELGRAILHALEDHTRGEKATASRTHWERELDASRRRGEFARRLRAVIEP